MLLKQKISYWLLLIYHYFYMLNYSILQHVSVLWGYSYFFQINTLNAENSIKTFLAGRKDSK